MWKDLDWTGSHSAFQSTKQLYLHWGPDTHTCHAGQYIFMYQIGNKSTIENKFINKKLNDNLPILRDFAFGLTARGKILHIIMV